MKRPRSSSPAHNPIFTLHHHGRQRVRLITGRYCDDNQLYVALEEPNGGLYTDVSVCIPDVPLAEGEFMFKTYSGNEGLLPAMMHAGIIKVVRTVKPPLGMLPVCRLA